MTDNEIIKALEEWRKELIADYQRLKLLDAPMDCFEESHADTVTKLSNALDLINRQRATIDSFTDIGKLYSEIKAEAYKECIEKVKEEIKQALKSNYKAVQGRIAYYENEGDMFVGDEFVDYCNGKIDCLRGLDDFLDNLLKELVGEEK